MRESRLSIEAGQQYALAYEAQYKTKEIKKAVAIYEDIIIAYPNSLEAGYSRSQIQNIANAVVPKKAVMDSLLELVRIHFAQNEPSDAEPASI